MGSYNPVPLTWEPAPYFWAIGKEWVLFQYRLMLPTAKLKPSEKDIASFQNLSLKSKDNQGTASEGRHATLFSAGRILSELLRYWTKNMFPKFSWPRKMLCDQCHAMLFVQTASRSPPTATAIILIAKLSKLKLRETKSPAPKGGAPGPHLTPLTPCPMFPL